MHNQPSAAIARYTQKATLSRKAPLLERLGTEIDEMSIETAIRPSNRARENPQDLSSAKIPALMALSCHVLVLWGRFLGHVSIWSR